MRLQIIMAHPDDEVIFGWPVLKMASSILICSNDKNNVDRAWCRYRYKALEELGEFLRIPVMYMDYDSEFYRLSARDGSLKKFQEDVFSHVNILCDAIYTHNFMGEYGHLDHILINQLMMKYFSHSEGLRLFTSDIHLDSEWIGFPDIAYGGPPIIEMQEVDNDLEFYNKCKAIYEKHGVWTWNQEPVMKCNLLEI
jgi:LmbE family N-acetylglucosaminyl deacetylase